MFGSGYDRITWALERDLGSYEITVFKNMLRLVYSLCSFYVFSLFMSLDFESRHRFHNKRRGCDAVDDCTYVSAMCNCGCGVAVVLVWLFVVCLAVVVSACYVLWLTVADVS